MKLVTTFTVLYCPVDGCDLESPFHATDKFLEHLEKCHEIKIYESSGVEPFLDQYLEKYKGILKNGFGAVGSEEDFEDIKIRQELHMKMLNSLLETQQMERNTIYKKPRMCLFCNVLCKNLPELFSHMFQDHHFNIGLLDNLIFVETFLNDLEEMTKLKKQCLFCKEIFRNGTCLRKHLKSKNHFKINGKDERWDRFYLVNYVNLVKGPKTDKSKDEVDEFYEEVDEWEDLKDEIDLKTQCLFCDHILIDPEASFLHMKQIHNFDMKLIQRKNKLTFYDTMKLINYLRNCQRHEENPFDDAASCFEDGNIPEMRLWNRPEFYFPVYDEDPLLTAIEDIEETETETEEKELIDQFFKTKI
jgi:hypothetical protein